MFLIVPATNGLHMLRPVQSYIIIGDNGAPEADYRWLPPIRRPSSHGMIYQSFTRIIGKEILI